MGSFFRNLFQPFSLGRSSMTSLKRRRSVSDINGVVSVISGHGCISHGTKHPEIPQKPQQRERVVPYIAPHSSARPEGERSRESSTMSKRGKIFHARSHLFLHFLRNQTVSSRVLLILLFQVAVDPRGTSFGCLWVCRWRLR